MLTSLHYYVHAKNLRYQLIPSKGIDDQRILQSDWTRGISNQKWQRQLLTSFHHYLNWNFAEECGYVIF